MTCRAAEAKALELVDLMLHFGLPAHAGFLLTVAVQAGLQAVTLLLRGPVETGIWLRVPKHICKRAMPAAAPESSNAFQGCGLSTHHGQCTHVCAWSTSSVCRTGVVRRPWWKASLPTEACLVPSTVAPSTASPFSLPGADRIPEAHALLAECRFRAAREAQAQSPPARKLILGQFDRAC